MNTKNLAYSTLKFINDKFEVQQEKLFVFIHVFFKDSHKSVKMGRKNVFFSKVGKGSVIVL